VSFRDFNEYYYNRDKLMINIDKYSE
jgi:hypothetical protein